MAISTAILLSAFSALVMYLLQLDTIAWWVAFASKFIVILLVAYCATLFGLKEALALR
jgi:hypothetical protein